jgi:hypothetical protein
MKTKILLYISLLCIMIFCTTCSKTEWFSHLTYEGHVVDQNKLPVPDAEVTLDACGGGSADGWYSCNDNKFEIGHATADASGHFKIKGRRSKIDYYFISVKHNNQNWGYNPNGVSENHLMDTIHIWW